MVSDERLLELAAAYLDLAGKPYEAARRPDGVPVVWSEYAGQFVRMHGFFAPLPALGAEPTTQQLHALMVTCLGTLDLLMQPIRSVIDGAMSPREAAEAMPPIDIRL